jgi:hypothetical protein
MEIKKITKHENKSKVASIVGDAATESNQKSIDQVWAKLEAVFSTESKVLSFLNKVWDKVNYKEFMDLVDHGFLDRIDDKNAKTMAAKIAESKNQSQAINVYYAEMKGLPAQHASGTNFNAQDTQGIRLRVFANGQVSTRGRITRNNFLPLQGQILEWYKPNSANKRFFTSLNGKRIFYTLNGTHIGEDAEWYELNTRTNTWIRID